MIELFGRIFNITEMLIMLFAISSAIAIVISLPIIIIMEMKLRKDIEKLKGNEISKKNRKGKK